VSKITGGKNSGREKTRDSEYLHLVEDEEHGTGGQVGGSEDRQQLDTTRRHRHPVRHVHHILEGI